MAALRTLARPACTASSSRLFSTAQVVRKDAPSSSEVATTKPETGKAPAVRPEGAVLPAGIVSGAPDELHYRPVRIYRPSQPTTQSAKANAHQWRLDWDILPGGGRWTNPLMGWASSADYMQGTHIKFNTREEAIRFCEKQGYEYFVQEPPKSKFKPKSYSTNFTFEPKKIRLVPTK